MQQDDQVPSHQPLPLHGYDIYHMPVEGGLWLQGQHSAAGETVRNRSLGTQGGDRHQEVNRSKLNMMVYFVCFFSCSDPQLAKKVNNVETSWALGATFDHFNNLNIH